MLLHDALTNRFEFCGHLVMETALHVGTGGYSSTSDAEVIRDFQGRPFIPGSSLKGALRAAVERRAEWLGLTSCCLGEAACFHDVEEDWRQKKLRERIAEMQEACAVCKLFGSTVFGGKVQVDDLPLEKVFEPLAYSLAEVRDGVAIDRDSGTAIPQAKFDYEVIPSQTAFRFYLTAENLTPENEALLALGLLEMMNGAVPIGGKSTRGLGRCGLLAESVFHFDFTECSPLNSEMLFEYLKPREERRLGKQADARAFLEESVRKFLGERNDAQEMD
jgi:CRISPR-associated RAMP protein (TIGR02581 family)